MPGSQNTCKSAQVRPERRVPKVCEAVGAAVPQGEGGEEEGALGKSASRPKVGAVVCKCYKVRSNWGTELVFRAVDQHTNNVTFL